MALFSPRDLLFVSACLLTHFIYRYRRRTVLPLPPGLLRWPILGNALSIPATYGHRFYKALGTKLGSKIIYLEALGQSIIVLNDAQMAKDLLEKRSALYSSRPHLNMIMDVIGINHLFSVMPYGDEWRNHRRLFQQYFSPKYIGREQAKGLEFVRKGLLPNLYQSPQDFLEHVRSCIGGFATSITYGLPIRRSHDPTVEFSEKAFSILTEAATPGRFVVDIMPSLKHVPEWVPGASFKILAREWRAILLRVRDEPYQATLAAIEDGSAPESFVSESLARHSDRSDYELQALHTKQAATQLYGAGSETTVAAALTFVLAMLKYPEVQKKAQREIDSIVGQDRLPDFSDQQHLPYLSAVLKEVIRWNPIVPLGVPHRTTEEDVYNGYYIPRGSIIIANTFAMLQDEAIFPNPEDFNPDRFLKDGSINTEVPDPEVYATFGFGRRICPGAHIGLSTLYIVSVSMLSLFDISPEIDPNGNPIQVVPEFKPASITSDPLPFQCKITPREGRDVEVLLKEFMDTEVI
ncbi:cytochrome P450 [Macrolepiota fuliginosa MF-IS2]|uniref:Cytochrome P450 n=1 Tax=Macrolepiota fuliginosa MF-IS2 TaxID=1400762 RepID=A0A9P5XEQ9_9AGAR|nr:cytochrome P450 [Macrolepiota fuliginosa MF-IS2]